MVEKLRALGIPIDLARVHELRGDGAMGRPHLARALVEAKAATSVEDAFRRYLAPGGPAWVEKERIALDEGLALVRGAGGITSIAHPSLYPEADTLVRTLLAEGVDGVEVQHPDVPADDRARWERLAAEMGKMTTGGSDDHGFAGRASMGTVRVPVERIQPIIERWQSVRR